MLAKKHGIKEFPYIIKDSNGNITYHETEDGRWQSNQYNSKGQVVYYETGSPTWFDKSVFWMKLVYKGDNPEPIGSVDSNGNITLGDFKLAQGLTFYNVGGFSHDIIRYEYFAPHPKNAYFHILINENENPVRMDAIALLNILDKKMFSYEEAKKLQIQLKKDELEFLINNQ